MKILLYSTLAVIAFLIGFFFAAQNPQEIVVDLFFTQLQWTIAQYIAVAFVIGFVVAFSLSLIVIFPLKAKIKSLDKKYLHQTKELENLRTLPVKDQL